MKKKLKDMKIGDKYIDGLWEATVDYVCDRYVVSIFNDECVSVTFTELHLNKEYEMLKKIVS